MPEQILKMGLNGVAMSPHGLVFDEDEATGCPMPLEAFPTPFETVLTSFLSILGRNGVGPFFPVVLLDIPFKGNSSLIGPLPTWWGWLEEKLFVFQSLGAILRREP